MILRLLTAVLCLAFFTLLIVGCSSNTRNGATQNNNDQKQMEISQQQTKATIEIKPNPQQELMNISELPTDEAAKYQADLPLTERAELIEELSSKISKNSMQYVEKMFPDIEVQKNVPLDDATNIMNLGPEIWYYSTEGDFTIITNETLNSPIYIFNGKNPTSEKIEEAKGAVKSMLSTTKANETQSGGNIKSATQ